MSDTAESLLFESEVVRGLRAVLFFDVVESVRLMARDEDGFVRCWLALLDRLRRAVLPDTRGRLVANHGDGCLLEFPSVAEAVRAAGELHELARQLDTHMPADAGIRLRIGIHLAQVVVGELDLYGAGVNLAARVTAAAEPGSTVVTHEAREPLLDGAGIELVDLGEHRLKHIGSSVRLYRVGPAGTSAGLARPEPLEIRPGIAVLPFRCVAGADRPGMGHAIADDLTAALSRTRLWRVISRLSTARCLGYESDPRLAEILGVPYLVTGSYRVQDRTVVLHVELCDGRRNEALWIGRYSLPADEVFSSGDPALPEIVQQIGRIVLSVELTRTGTLPFGRLEDYCLHLAAITLMHRLRDADMQRAGQLIDALEERHPRSAEPAAMRARWHALRMAQGMAQAPELEARCGLESAARALQRDPIHSFALPMHALLSAQTGGSLGAALADAQQALDTHPQEPMAALAVGMLRGYLGDAAAFEAHTQESTALSPVDPAVYVYLSIVASAKLSAGKPAQAIDACARALRAHASYAPAHLMMTTALAMSGNLAAAAESARVFLGLEPQFRVSRHAAEFAGRQPPNLGMRLEALRAAGLPD